jgi:HEAT repeat protein
MDNRIDSLIGKLRGDDAQAAMTELAQMGTEAVEPLIAVLSEYETYDDYSADSQRHHWAEEALVLIGSPAVAPLLRALQDEAWGAHAGGAYILGKIGDQRAVQPLIDAMRFEEMHGGETREALLGFGEIALRPLLHALKHHENAVVRRGAASTLGDFPDPLVIPALVEALEADEDDDVRQIAAYILGKRGDARAVEPLIARLEDDTPSVREAAARALGALGEMIRSPRITEALGNALHDADWGTRQSAAEMLIRLQSEQQKEAEALLLDDLQSDDVEVRLGAAWSLLELGDERALAPLLELLKHSETRVAEMAAVGLGMFGSQQAVLPLTAALNRGDEAVQKAARDALRRLGEPD